MIKILKLKGKDILWSYIGTIFNMGIGVFMLPFLLKYLESDVLGLWYVMVSLSNIANLFTFGFTPAFSRNIAYCWNGAERLYKNGKDIQGENNQDVNYRLLNKVLLTSRYVYFLISILATLCLAILGSMHIFTISKEIMSLNIKLSWIVFLVAIFMNLYYGYFSSYLIGIGRVKESNQISVITGSLRILVMAILMQRGMGILGASIAYFVYGLSFRTLSKKVFFLTVSLDDTRKIGQNIQLTIEEVKECFSIIWYNAWRDGLVSIADFLQTQFSTLVCSCFLTLSETAVFSLTTQLIGMLGKVARSIHNAHIPVFQSAYISNAKDIERETQAFCIFLFSIVYIIGVIGVIIVGVPIIRFFKPGTVMNYTFLALYAVYQFMLSYRNCYGAYLSCTNRVVYWKSYIITGFGCVGAYIILLAFFRCGIWGIVITSIISEALYNFWKWPRMVNCELDLKFKDIMMIGNWKIKEAIIVCAKRLKIMKTG